MLKINCSKLEEIKQSPELYAQILATFNFQEQRRQGMFAVVKRIALLGHKNNLSDKECVKLLQTHFLKFNQTSANKTRQEILIDNFLEYYEAFHSMGFSVADGNRCMKWSIIPSVQLTGYTPWVMKRHDGYYAYIVAEHNYDWENQLRFPLYQSYIAGHTMDCDTNELHVGIYDVQSKNFEFRSFSSVEIGRTVVETQLLLTNVSEEYKRLTMKKSA